MELSLQLKERLASARRRDVEAVREIERSLGDISQSESAVVVDLFLSYRAVKAWADMVALVGKMSKPLAATVMVQEQLALALNRQGDGDRAEQILLELIRRRGPSSETYGILGRVYKDRWDRAVKSNQSALARGILEKAISAYLAGFEADWRDGYPGINAVTLMDSVTHQTQGGWTSFRSYDMRFPAGSLDSPTTGTMRLCWNLRYWLIAKKGPCQRCPMP